MKWRNIIRTILTMCLVILLVACAASGLGQGTGESGTATVFPETEPNPSVTPDIQPTLPALPALEPQRPPDPGITVSETTPDGSLWYAFDVFDDIGGSLPGNLNGGLYRSKAGRITHYEIPGTVRVLEAAPDGSLLIGAGCGVWRFRDDEMESLLDLSCDKVRPVAILHPLDIALAENGLIWVGGAFTLASYDGDTWQEYNVPSVRVAIATDGSIWTRGWDGRAGSDCCLSRITATGVNTYTWSADIPADVDVLATLFGSSGR